MSEDYSKTAFLTFLDYLANKGLMKKPTVSARKASVSALLGVLDDNEVEDVRNIDIDSMTQRFANLQGQNFTPGSMQTYKSRYKSALSDFLAYRKDPVSFSPNISTRQRKPSDGTSTKVPSSKPDTNIIPAGDRQKDDVAIDTFNIPIPLRSGCIIQISGIPTNLTSTEAKKIANVVVALATEDEQ